MTGEGETQVSCPNADTLREFSAGRLPAERSTLIASHLSQCGACRESLKSLGLPEFDPSDPYNTRLSPFADAETQISPQPGPPLNSDVSKLFPAGTAPLVAHFRLVREIGRGGMGVVFEAEDTHLHRRVALKLMLPNLGDIPDARERFLREARTAASVKHEHVVTVYHVGTHAGVPFIALELLEGETLKRRLERCGRLPTPEVVRIGQQMAAGLAAAHARGLLHRDIKPDNVWLEGNANSPCDRGGRVKLLDFGLARAVADTSSLTRLGSFIGSPGYSAPEQSDAGPVDHRADLFSFGCVLYQMATGRLPFPGQGMVTYVKSLAVETPLPACAANPELPPELGRLIDELIAKSPQDRPADAPAVAARLDEFAASLSSSGETHPTSDAGRRKEMLPGHPGQGRRFALGLAGGVLGTLALVIAFWRPNPSPPTGRIPGNSVQAKTSPAPGREKPGDAPQDNPGELNRPVTQPVEVDRKSAAKRVAEIVGQQLTEKRPLFVREFRGPTQVAEGLAQSITYELVLAGYPMELGAPAELEGRVVLRPRDSERKPRGYTIRCTLYLEDGEERPFEIELQEMPLRQP